MCLAERLSSKMRLCASSSTGKPLIRSDLSMSVLLQACGCEGGGQGHYVTLAPAETTCSVYFLMGVHGVLLMPAPNDSKQTQNA